MGRKRQSYKGTRVSKTTPRGGLGRCFYCDDERATTVDHYIPLSRGGSSAPANLVPACGPCNLIKDNMLPEEFFWHCKEVLQTGAIKDEKFLVKARKILASLAPDLLEKLDSV